MIKKNTMIKKKKHIMIFRFFLLLGRKGIIFGKLTEAHEHLYSPSK